MSYKQIATKLQQEFPELDLTQSVVTDVLHAHQNNKDQAKKHLQQFQVQLLGEKEEKVHELEQQFQLPRELIIETLEINNWNVEASILPLFLLFEETINQKNAQVQQEREAQLKNQPKPAEDSPFISVIRANSNEKESPFKSTIAMSATTNQKQVTLIVTPEMVDTGNPITVEWEMTNGKTNSYDWIGLFAADQPNRNYVTYEWRGKEETKGSVTFTAPSTFGYYEFRYIPSGSYEHIAISNQIKVGPVVDLIAHADKDSRKVSVKWDKKAGNPYPRAWVGLYSTSEVNNKNYLHWQYTTEPFTEASFAAPIKPGEYEFRYFPYGYVDTTRSNTIVIDGHDTLVATVGTDNTVTAKVSVVTVDPYYDGVWIGLYLKSEKDNKNLKRYKYITERETQVSFRAPEAGEYEFRLFAKKSYDTILASNSITV